MRRIPNPSPPVVQTVPLPHQIALQLLPPAGGAIVMFAPGQPPDQEEPFHCIKSPFKLVKLILALKPVPIVVLVKQESIIC